MRSQVLLLLLTWWLSGAAQGPISSQFFAHASSQPTEKQAEQRFSWSDRSAMQFHSGAYQSFRSNGADGFSLGIGFYVSYGTYYGNLRIDLLQEIAKGPQTPHEQFTVIDFTMGKDLDLHGILLDFGGGLGYISGVKRGGQLQPGDVPSIHYSPDLHEVIEVRMIDIPLEAQLIYRAGKKCDIGIGTVIHACPSYPYIELRAFVGFGS